MNPNREQKIRQIIQTTQPDLAVILENIFDPLNISAVMRTCDAVGVREVFVVYTREYLERRKLKLGKKTSGGVFKWTDVYLFEDVDECLNRARERFGRVLAAEPPEDLEQFWTDLPQQPSAAHAPTAAGKWSSLYDLDLTQPTALLFGNEDEGVTPESLALADGFFSIPMSGFVESLNISVAAAVALFEARRQRALAGFYAENQRLAPEQQELLFRRWEAMLKNPGWKRRLAVPISKASAPLLPVFVERTEHLAGYSKALPLSRFDL